MSDNERFYDEEVAPALAALGDRCRARGMAFVATVEYDPGERGSTFVLPEASSLAMRMLEMCANTGNNVDAYMLRLKRYCHEHSIGTEASIFLRYPNAPTPPEARAVDQPVARLADLAGEAIRWIESDECADKAVSLCSDLQKAIHAALTPQTPASAVPPKLTRKQIRQAMADSDWPEALIAPMVETKLVQFAAEVESAVRAQFGIKE